MNRSHLQHIIATLFEKVEEIAVRAIFHHQAVGFRLRYARQHVNQPLMIAKRFH